MSIQQIWRDGGEAKQRTLRMMWPDLADALEGTKMDPADIPTCDFCDVRRSLGKAGSRPICGQCVGTLPLNYRGELKRYADG